MKKIILISAILFTTIINAQNFVNVTVWKATTKSNGLFLGIAKNNFEAQNNIEEVKFDKLGTKYQITESEILNMTINIQKNTSAYQDFISDHATLKYKYISEIELISLQYYGDNNMNMAVEFFKNASRVKNRQLVENHLKKLHKNYAKYLIRKNEAPDIVNYSDQYVSKI